MLYFVVPVYSYLFFDDADDERGIFFVCEADGELEALWRLWRAKGIFALLYILMSDFDNMQICPTYDFCLHV